MAPKVDAKGESLNICSEFYLIIVFMGWPKGRKNVIE